LIPRRIAGKSERLRAVGGLLDRLGLERCLFFGETHRDRRRARRGGARYLLLRRDDVIHCQVERRAAQGCGQGQHRLRPLLLRSSRAASGVQLGCESPGTEMAGNVGAVSTVFFDGGGSSASTAPGEVMGM
jgi:hypothetical protein